jgi:predicted nucleic acid-binding protein
MRYTLDASVGLKWALREADSPTADALRQDYRAGVHELISPDTFSIEVAHALTRAERRKIIAVGQAVPLLANVLSTAPVLFPYISLLDRATEISSQTRQGVYDCLYVALAEAEGCDLITADDKLVKNLGPLFPFIVPLASLP